MTQYDIYKLTVLDFMKHGDSLNTAHRLTCLVLNHQSIEEDKEYKEKLEKEIKENT